LGGATSVVGGQAPVDNDDTSASLLADVVLRTANGDHPSAALRAAVQAHLAAHPLDRGEPPSQWATLVVWTTNPPAADGGHPLRHFWTSQGGQRAGSDSGTADGSIGVEQLVPDEHQRVEPRSVEMSRALVRALSYVRAAVIRRPVTSQDVFAAIVATDNADWTSFLVGLGRAAPEWSVYEPSGPFVDVVLPGHEVMVTTTEVGTALTTAEALAIHLGDPVIAPAHLVYGMLRDDAEASALPWLQSDSELKIDLIELLGDRVFDMDLPAPNELTEPAARPSSALPRAGRGRPPAIDAEVRAAALNKRCDILGTAEFLACLCTTDPITWAHLESGVSAFGCGTNVEVEAGGFGVELDRGTEVTATRAFAAAVSTARRIAYYLGAPTVSAAHVAYAILCDTSSDGARCWRADHTHISLADLARAMFGHPLPDLDRLEPSPTRESLLVLALVPFVPVVQLAHWAGTKIVHVATALAVLALIGVTASLRSVYHVPDIAATMRADLPKMTASVVNPTVSVQTPAVLLGPLSRFYVQPQVTGTANQWRDTLRRRTPKALDGWYAFVMPSQYRGRHVSSTSNAMIDYRSHHFPANVSCQGELARVACIVTAHLPRGVAPSKFSWSPEHLNGTASDAKLSDRALVLGTTNATTVVDTADLWALASNVSTTHEMSLATRDTTARHALAAVTPVVLSGKSGNLPLLGFAFGNPKAAKSMVLEAKPFLEVAGSLANGRVGPVKGAIAYLGVLMSTTQSGAVRVTVPQLGGPADDAHVVPGDVIDSVDGTRVHSAGEVTRLVRRHEPGDHLRLEISHNGRNRRVAVTLGYLPLGQN
jgi:hypothetical protein